MKLSDSLNHRPDEAMLLFEKEIFGVAQSLSLDKESLYHGTKSDMLKGSDTVNQPIVTCNSAMIVNLSAVIRFVKQKPLLNLHLSIYHP